VKLIINYYSTHFACIINTSPQLICSDLAQIMKTYSPLGKCHTYLNNIYNNINQNMTIDSLLLFQFDRMNLILF